MIIRKIAIYDSDTEYALRLAEYISEYRTREYKVLAFSDMLKLENFIETEGADIVLADEKSIVSLRDKVDMWSINKAIALTEEKGGDNDESIFKYQAAEEIVLRMEELAETVPGGRRYEEKESYTPTSIEKFEKIMLVSVAFPLDVCNIALGINHFHNNQYLIIDCSILSGLFDVKENKLSLAIYLLEKDMTDRVQFEDCVSLKNEVAYIAGINDSSDIMQLSDKGINRLSDIAKDMGYKGIIFVCDSNGAMALSRWIDKKDIIVLEGGGKRIRDYTYKIIKGMGGVKDKRIRLINTDNIRERHLNQVVDFEDEDYDKGGLSKLINELCRK